MDTSVKASDMSYLKSELDNLSCDMDERFQKMANEFLDIKLEIQDLTDTSLLERRVKCSGFTSESILYLRGFSRT